MSMRYKGGVISATPPTVTTTSAPGLWTLEQQMQYQAAGVWPQSAIPDPFFEYVTMLLHGDGTNGAQNNTFLDSSTNNFSITRNGDTTQGTFSPFSRAEGNWSNYFNNLGYLSLGSNAALLPGSGDFTVEAWFNASALGGGTAGYNCIFSYGGSTGNLRLFLLGTAPHITVWSGANLFLNVDVSATVKIGGWNHVAIVRSGSTITVYLNGTVVGSPVSNSDNFSGTLNIGSEAGSYLWTGYISNVRVVKGTAVYTSAFTPPIAPLTAIANTGVLTCQSNSFKDNSANNFAVTVTNNPSVQVFNPFNPTTAYLAATNGGSGYFDGTGDYLVVGSGSTGALGSGDFCVEAWVYRTSTADAYFLSNLVSSGGGDGQFNLGIFSGSITFTGWFTTFLSGTSPAPNQWVHYVTCRSGTTMSLYANGTRLATTSTANNFSSSNDIRLGAYASGSNPLAGYMGSSRVVVGSSVYDPAQSTLTVPTAPFTNIANTRVLCNFTNGGIFDNAAMNNLQTFGDAQISTAQSKFGGGSMYFDGSDYLTTKPSSTDNFAMGTGDWTVECWLYLTAVSGIIQSVFDTLPFSAGATTAVRIFISSGAVQLYQYSTPVTSGGSLSTNIWYHIAVCKASGITRIFVNGSQVNTNYSDIANYICGANRPIIGAEGFSLLNPLNGYIDDMRVTKGYARYTANFTPPTAAFPNL
jgi:hypothetical protein